MSSEYTQYRRIFEDSHEKMRRSPFSGFLGNGIDYSSIRFDSVEAGRHEESTESLLAAVREWLADSVDPERIENNAQVPDEYILGLRELGCFRAKIPISYGGLGLSQASFARLLELIASRSEVLALMVSVQQLGVIQSLLSEKDLDNRKSSDVRAAGEALRQKYLRRLAGSALGAFCLTTAEAGSDPGRLKTLARACEDGQTFLLSGAWKEGGKLYTTLGTIADCYLMLAVVLYPGEDPQSVDRRSRITAFLVDRKVPGITIKALQFCGWRGLPNAAIKLDDVRVAGTNMVGGIGEGLKVAFKNLATGRINIAAICLGMMKNLEQCARWWGARRIQGGKPIGEHALNAQQLLRMNSSIYAVESYTRFVAALADSPGSDVRLEAAILKLFASEALIETADQTLQIRGGRGYETYASQLNRGDIAIPVERLYRSARLMRIGEGGSNILRLYIIRCLLDTLINDYKSLRQHPSNRFSTSKRTVKFGIWVFAAVLRSRKVPAEFKQQALYPHLEFVERNRNRLVRQIYFKLLREGLAYYLKVLWKEIRIKSVDSSTSLVKPDQSFEQRQVLLGHYAEIAMNLSVMTVTCFRAAGDKDACATELADHFCIEAREKIAIHFLQISHYSKRVEQQMQNRGKQLLSGKYADVIGRGTVPFDLP